MTRNTPSVARIRTVVGAVVVLSLAACGGADAAEQIIEAQLGDDVDIDLDADSGDIQIRTEDGSLSSTSSAELPDDFPAGMPTPGGQLVNSSRIESDGRVVHTLIFNQAGDVTEEVYDEYERALTALGYETTFESVGGGTVVAQITDGTTLVTFNGGDVETGAEYQVIVAPVEE